MLVRILKTTLHVQLEAALAQILDVDETLRFMAVDVALVNGDGYWTRGSDFSLYRDPKGRFHITTHDANETFSGGPGLAPGRGPGGLPPPPGGLPPNFVIVTAPAGVDPQRGGRAGPGGPGGIGMGGADLDPLVGLTDATKPLRSKLLAVPALRERYLGYVRDIAEKWLDWRTLGPIAQTYHALIADDVKLDTRKLYSFEDFRTGLTGNSGSVKEF